MLDRELFKRPSYASLIALKTLFSMSTDQILSSGNHYDSFICMDLDLIPISHVKSLDSDSLIHFAEFAIRLKSPPYKEYMVKFGAIWSNKISRSERT